MTAPDDSPAPSREERAVLFADVADSTRLFREHGDLQARAFLVAALATGRAQVERAGGRVIEVIGDELFCELPDVTAGLAAAVGLHRALQESRRDGALPAGLAFRVGLACGPVGRDGAHVFGDTVYLAKRVSTAAKAEQVLTTRESLRDLAQPELLNLRALDTLRLKGRTDEVELLEVVWSSDATLEVEDAPRPVRSQSTGTLVVTHGALVREVTSEAPRLTLGRGETCDLCLDDARVSRLHARIELRRDGFVLVDMSRNGCLVAEGDEPPRTIVRDELALGAQGEIRLGPDDDAPRVRFETRAPSS